MNQRPTDQPASSDLAAREQRGWKFLFWFLTPLPILGFISNPFSWNGLASLSVVIAMWKFIYVPFVSRPATEDKAQTIVQAERGARGHSEQSIEEKTLPTAQPAPMTVGPIGWLFIALGTLAFPIGMTLGAAPKKVDTFSTLILAGLGFMLSSVLVLLVTLLVHSAKEGNKRT